MAISVVPLHEHPEYLLDCCNLINAEWKRSEAARLHSLISSSKQLPTSLILLMNKNVIGHLRLTPIPSIKSACFVETVVILKGFRGKGYGSLLMKKAEEYCINMLSLDTMYLSTKGQERFYTTLGFTECPPVGIYGCYVPNKEQKENKAVVSNNTSINNQNVPQPPPLPSYRNVNGKITSKTYMKKELSTSIM